MTEKYELMCQHGEIDTLYRIEAGCTSDVAHTRGLVARFDTLDDALDALTCTRTKLRYNANKFKFYVTEFYVDKCTYGDGKALDEGNAVRIFNVASNWTPIAYTIRKGSETLFTTESLGDAVALYLRLSSYIGNDVCIYANAENVTNAVCFV